MPQHLRPAQAQQKLQAFNDIAQKIYNHVPIDDFEDVVQIKHRLHQDHLTFEHRLIEGSLNRLATAGLIKKRGKKGFKRIPVVGIDAEAHDNSVDDYHPPVNGNAKPLDLNGEPNGNVNPGFHYPLTRHRQQDQYQKPTLGNLQADEDRTVEAVVEKKRTICKEPIEVLGDLAQRLTQITKELEEVALVLGAEFEDNTKKAESAEVLLRAVSSLTGQAPDVLVKAASDNLTINQEKPQKAEKPKREPAEKKPAEKKPKIKMTVCYYCKASVPNIVQHMQDSHKAEFELPTQLREWREKEKISQVDLAERAGVLSNYICMYEKGRHGKMPIAAKEALDKFTKKLSQ